ncbi:MAG: tyrosine-type recombinase/integrase [Bacteroidales bacterium]|nr:tyrosine-type recombinase/integrase [Bacteroidales bacterium]
MNIRFNTKGMPPAPIRVVVSHRGKTWQKAVGITVKEWNNRTQKCGHSQTDSALKTIRIGLESVLDDFSTEKDIERAIKRVYKGRWNDDTPVPLNAPKKPRFAPLFKAWADSPRGAQRQNKSAAKIVLEIVGERVEWSDIDSAFYASLMDGFRSRGMRPNYQGVVLGRLKTFLNECYARHYIDNANFREWPKPHEDTFAIALTQSEVDAVWNAKLDAKLSKVRDLFILGVYTAARFSDYSRLTSDNIKDDKIEFVQEKTDTPVLIPCSPRVKAIMERNGGRAPRMCIQTFNKKIKDVCKEAGIGSVIQVPPGTLAHLGKDRGDVVRKWELCSSHTARRTGASLLYKSGVPVRVCRYLTGHTKDDTFLKYIKIDREEAADILAKSPFFGE